MRPSFIGIAINGVILVVTVIIMIYNWYNFKLYEKLILFILVGLMMGLHNIMHYLDEIHFGFNPLAGQWTIRDAPIRTPIPIRSSMPIQDD